MAKSGFANSLKALVLTVPLILGIGQAYAKNPVDDAAANAQAAYNHIKEFSKEKDYNYTEKQIKKMINSAYERMMNIPDQPLALNKRENYEMKKEIARQMLYN